MVNWGLVYVELFWIYLYFLCSFFFRYFIFNCGVEKKLKEEVIIYLLLERLFISRIMYNKWIVVIC